jgi:hypothetical protein
MEREAQLVGGSRCMQLWSPTLRAEHHSPKNGAPRIAGESAEKRRGSCSRPCRGTGFSSRVSTQHCRGGATIICPPEADFADQTLTSVVLLMEREAQLVGGSRCMQLWSPTLRAEHHSPKNGAPRIAGEYLASTAILGYYQPSDLLLLSASGCDYGCGRHGRDRPPQAAGHSRLAQLRIRHAQTGWWRDKC